MEEGVKAKLEQGRTQQLHSVSYSEEKLGQ